jgi:hypothetical protein
MALGLIQPRTKINTANLPGNRGRSERKADKYTAVGVPIVQKIWSLYISQPYGSPRPVIDSATFLAFIEDKLCYCARCFR